MDIREIREQASALGVDSSFYAPKLKLVRAIQRRLGQAPCFAGEERFSCTDHGCRWREDCFMLIAEWRR